MDKQFPEEETQMINNMRRWLASLVNCGCKLKQWGKQKTIVGYKLSNITLSKIKILSHTMCFWGLGKW